MEIEAINRPTAVTKAHLTAETQLRLAHMISCSGRWAVGLQQHWCRLFMRTAEVATYFLYVAIDKNVLTAKLYHDV